MAKRMTNPVEPAFNYNDDYPEEGLNKREYFAAMAMQGFITTDVYLIDDCARYAVKAADALIAELNK
jgi:hypothetical protein